MLHRHMCVCVRACVCDVVSVAMHACRRCVNIQARVRCHIVSPLGHIHNLPERHHIVSYFYVAKLQAI